MRYAVILLFTVLSALWASAAAAQRVDVAELQRALAKLGYQPGPVNGKWGVETRGALFQFQRENGFGTSLDIGPEQLRLLGMLAPPPTIPTSPPIDLEPDSATPIVGDLDATMQLYGQLAAHIIFMSFQDQARMTIVTTASNPAEITLLPPDPESYYANVFALNGASFETSGIHLTASELRHRKASAPDLADFTSPESETPAPDRLCDDAAPGAEWTHICVVSGQIGFGGTFKLGDNIVSCRDGAMTISNANRDQVFATGSLCSVNGNPVRLSDTGWTEDPA